MRTHLTRAALAVAALTLSGVAACSSSPESAGPAPTHRVPRHAAVAVGGCLMSVSTDINAKPTLSAPDSPACTTTPTKLAFADVIPGTGSAAKAGDSLSVKYVGLHWTTKQQFQASWDGSPQTFDVSPLGTASVIPGWNQGLIGVRRGDRRILVVPASLAYGDAGSGEIAPNEALIFIVDIVSVTPGAAPSASVATPSPTG
ncbi:MAG TPA: FKBP-type peptidyl-prolyl cis-trans isomerase [Micromonosporaceae bacterium]|nr:FKBP-type peptidyl-prolyl cis-trans isomerase [Micromonosporaceae bacterium]